ncbi:MAG: OB-fold domain-containing protein [Acidimicrobiia bacterium]
MEVTKPIAEDLFTQTGDGPRIVGSRCGTCHTVVFPKATSCPRCGNDEMDEHLLAPRGTLFTFTTQGFLPKEPYTGPETEEDFTGYALGYVELPGEVMVETRITEADVSRLAIGMEMELVIVPFRTEPDGTQVTTFAFQPVGSDS